MAELIWRLLNYLCVGMLYLKDNVISPSDLCMDDFKDTIVGHWGACPGVNAILAHIMSYVTQKQPSKSVKIIIGTGHAGPSLLAASFIDGTMEKYYPLFNRNKDGVKNLFNAYSDSFSSEIDVRYPGNIYCGGELGASLSFSQGYIFNHPERIVACIMGDGEFETPVCQASFQGFQFIDKQRDGRVIPIINLNGYKMGGKSTLSNKSESEIAEYFSFFGLKAIFANENHDTISRSITQCFDIIDADGYPILILRTPKGWTAPKCMGGQQFEGSHKSHKPILRNPATNQQEFIEVKKWLMSYGCEDFFNSDGEIIPKISNYLNYPKESIFDFNRNYKTICCREFPSTEAENNPSACCNILKNQEEIIVFSPDELDSNGFSAAKDVCRTIELLSEQTCFGWCQGYAGGGGIPVLVTYEAFAPLLDSMIDQYLKSINVMERMGCHFPPVIIVVTSLGWRNVPSHHNPSFSDRLVTYCSPHVELHYPLSPKHSARILSNCLATYNKLSVLIMDKRRLPLLHTMRMKFIDGCWLLRDADAEEYIQFVAVGDIVAEEVLKAYNLLSPTAMRYIKIIGLEEIGYTLDNKKYASSIYNVWIYNGRVAPIEALLWRSKISMKNNNVIGFKGSSDLPSGYLRLKENQLDCESIVDLMKTLINSYIGGGNKWLS